MTSRKRPKGNTLRDVEPDIGPIVGRGTYATVYASNADPSNIIYRVESLSMDNREEVKREAAIQKFLYDQDISPCFPRLYETKEIVASGKLFMMSKMERGSEGTLLRFADKMKGKIFAHVTFMLYWTLWVANSRFGFLHRDLKPKNIVVKKLSAPEIYYFTIDNYGIFTIETQYVPLIIDFGLSSLASTRLEERFNHGTPLFTPPEALGYDLMFDHVSLNVYGNQQFSEDGYDFWALLFAVISVKLGDDSIFTIGYEKTEQALDTLISSPSVEKESRMKYLALFQVCLFEKAIGNGIFPPNSLIGREYSAYLFTPDLRERLIDFDEENKVSEKMSEFWKTLGFAEWRKEFARLLGWDTGLRIVDGNAWQNLEFFVESENIWPPIDSPNIYINNQYPLFRENTDEEFKVEQLEILRQVPHIRTKICEVCMSEPSRLICARCSAVVCGRACHQQCERIKNTA